MRHRVLAAVAAALVVPLLAAGCAASSRSQQPDNAATVNGTPITVDELNSAVAEAAQTIPVALGTSGTAALTQSVLTSLIRTQLLLDGAAADSYALTRPQIDRLVSEAVAQAGQPGATLGSLLRQGNAQRPVADASTPQSVQFSIGANQLAIDLLARDAAAHPAQYLAYHVRHVLVHDEATAFKVRALLEHGASWNTVAAKYSIDTGSKSHGGDLGTITRGETVAPFQAEVLKLASEGGCAGVTTGPCTSPIGQPVHSQYGWHVIQVLGVTAPALSQLQSELAGQQYQQARATAFAAWFHQLASTAAVRVNERFGVWDAANAAVAKRPTAPSGSAATTTTVAAGG